VSGGCGQRPFHTVSRPSEKSRLCIGSGTEEITEEALMSCPSSAPWPTDDNDCNTQQNGLFYNAPKPTRGSYNSRNWHNAITSSNTADCGVTVSVSVKVYVKLSMMNASVAYRGSTALLWCQCQAIFPHNNGHNGRAMMTQYNDYDHCHLYIITANKIKSSTNEVNNKMTTWSLSSSFHQSTTRAVCKD